MAPKKTSAELPLRSPVTFRPSSSDERLPEPRSRRDEHAERLFLARTEQKSKKLGMGRRAFIESSCGAATALVIMNEVYGCGTDGVYDVSDASTLDAAQACQRLTGDEFIFDVQTHHVNPHGRWREIDPAAAQGLLGFEQTRCGESDPIECLDAKHYVREIFIHSDTHVACLSGIPAEPDRDPLANDDRIATRELVNGLSGSQRLLIHASVVPQNGARELDAMQRFAEAQPTLAAWKVYPSFGSWRLSDEAVGRPFLERARALGVRRVAAHRGISGDAGGYDDFSSPRDLVAAAEAYPDLTFIAYHSGWEPAIVEGPYDAANPRGVDRLIRALEVHGNRGNVYAELGTTWRALMTKPTEAAHVLGKLLRHLGEDHILWGTDCIWTGSPQEQIIAFRAFQIPAAMQEQYNYPALSADVKRKIFGLNGARVYGVDAAAVRCAIRDDRLSRARTVRVSEPHRFTASFPHYGPRTRREFLGLTRRRG